MSSSQFLGHRRSGKKWREDGLKHRLIVRSGFAKKDWDTKCALRQQKQIEKQLRQERLDKQNAEKQAEKEKREANKLRREENAKRSVLVQKITNVHKLKRMTKKQFSQLKRV